MPATLPPVNIRRGCYGQITDCLCPRGVPAPAEYSHAKQLLGEAIAAGILPAGYRKVRSRDRYEALCYYIYDFAPGMALVQLRLSSKSVFKIYYLICRDSLKGLTVEDVEYAKYLVRRTANATGLIFGFVIDRVIGRREARRLAARKR